MHFISVCSVCSVPSSRQFELCFDCDEESGWVCCVSLLCSFPVGPDELLLLPVCPDVSLLPVCPDELLCLLVRDDELPCSDSLDEVSGSLDELDELDEPDELDELFELPLYLEYKRKEPYDLEESEEEPDEELDEDDLDDLLEHELSVSLTLEWRDSDKIAGEPPPPQRLRPLRRLP